MRDTITAIDAMREDDPARIESTLRKFFEADDRGLIAVYLFGSVARGTPGPGSDVDIALLYRTAPAPTLDAQPLDLEANLEAQLGRPVQALVLNQASPDVAHRVLRDGELVLDGDPAARIRFEVRIRNEYFDILPVLRRYRRAGVA